MKLSKIGEFGLIDRIRRSLKERLPAGMTGIGDDCAVIPAGGGECLLVTTDMLVENTHFLIGRIEPADLGHKSLAVNLSDIAAMGGRPEWAFVSLAVPPETTVEFLDGFYAGMRRLARRHGVGILGGDTTRSGLGLVISVTVTGRADRRRIKYRSGARKGDIIALTGPVGDSAAGLTILLNGRALDRDARYLVRKHNRPEPALAEGRWLASRREVGAMMDVSDGPDSDIRRVMERSGCGADIHLERMPVSLPLCRKAAEWGADPAEIAASGGEDYCLLLTAAPDGFDRLSAGFKKAFGRPLHAVGVITVKKSGLRYFRHGKKTRFRSRGFQHFEPARKDVKRPA